MSFNGCVVTLVNALQAYKRVMTIEHDFPILEGVSENDARVEKAHGAVLGAFPACAAANNTSVRPKGKP